LKEELAQIQHVLKDHKERLVHLFEGSLHLADQGFDTFQYFRLFNAHLLLAEKKQALQVLILLELLPAVVLDCS
jgi:hypothetical protein